MRLRSVCHRAFLHLVPLLGLRVMDMSLFKSDNVAKFQTMFFENHVIGNLTRDRVSIDTLHFCPKPFSTGRDLYKIARFQ